MVSASPRGVSKAAEHIPHWYKETKCGILS